MKKIVIVIFSLIVYILLISKVYAYNITKVNSDYYYTRYNTDGTEFSDKAVTYYIDNKPVFCIEPGKKLGSTYNIDENYNITSDNKLRILLAAHYGYMYGNNKDYRYSLATQSIIWKELLGSYPVYSTKLFGEGDILDLSYFISVIEGRINRYYKSMNIVTKDDIHIGNTIHFEDTTKTIGDYTSSDVTINPINGHLFDKTFYEVGKYKFFFERKKEYKEKYKIFTNGDNQALLMAGFIPELDYTYEFEVKPVRIKINVKDSETKEVINECTLDIDGKSVPCNSTYTFNEAITSHKIKLESVPNNYVLNEKVINYRNYSKEETETTIYVDPYYNDYTIYKTYDEEFPEENAIFELTDDKGNLIDTYTTDENGTFNLHLKPGDYILNQIQGKEGYTLVKTEIKSLINNGKSLINPIHLNDEKILDNNDVEVDIINDHPQPENLTQDIHNIQDTISKSLVSTGDELSLICLFIVFSLICLLTKKVIVI